MAKSATDVMQEIIVSATLEALGAMKAASKGLPNNLVRDLNAIHANTTFGDLPAEVQASITASVRAAFTRLLKEGYSISSGRPAPGAAPRRAEGTVVPRGHRGPAPRRPGGGADGPRPPRKGGGPGRPNKPRGPKA
jgi:hypothetical protein